MKERKEILESYAGSSAVVWVVCNKIHPPLRNYRVRCCLTNREQYKDMQFRGGYKYPSGAIFIILSASALCITVFLYCYKNLSSVGGLSLFLNLEGTVLLASSLTPVGLTPPPTGLIQKIKWFFMQEHGIPLGYNQPMLYAGLLSLSLAAIISAK